MNGFVKSPWKWNEIFDMCAKFFLALSQGQQCNGGIITTTVDVDLVEELYCMVATESEEIYINRDLIKAYCDVCEYVLKYEERSGEIKV